MTAHFSELMYINLVLHNLGIIFVQKDENCDAGGCLLLPQGQVPGIYFLSLINIIWECPFHLVNFYSTSKPTSNILSLLSAIFLCHKPLYFFFRASGATFVTVHLSVWLYRLSPSLACKALGDLESLLSILPVVCSVPIRCLETNKYSTSIS